MQAVGLPAAFACSCLEQSCCAWRPGKLRTRSLVAVCLPLYPARTNLPELAWSSCLCLYGLACVPPMPRLSQCSWTHHLLFGSRVLLTPGTFTNNALSRWKAVSSGTPHWNLVSMLLRAFQRSNNGGKAWAEPPVVTHKPQEGLHFLRASRGLSVLHCRDLAGSVAIPCWLTTWPR